MKDINSKYVGLSELFHNSFYLINWWNRPKIKVYRNLLNDWRKYQWQLTIRAFHKVLEKKSYTWLNLDELENEAKYVIPEAAYYYIASGAENEWTWRNNTPAFNHFQIVPRALTGMPDPKLYTEFLRMGVKTPVMNCPIAWQGIAKWRQPKWNSLRGAKGRLGPIIWEGRLIANQELFTIAANRPSGDLHLPFQATHYFDKKTGKLH